MNSNRTSAIEAVVFDMDGLLIDSEPIWQNSEMQIFGRYGLELSRSDCMQTMGLRIDEVVEYWKKNRNFHPPVSDSQVVQEVLQEVKHQIQRGGQAMPGAVELVDRLSGMPLAVASSSYPEIIEAALKRLEIHSLFQVIHSAQQEKLGKPAPDVYLTACQQLKLSPDQCLAIEDSPGGVKSALAAGMWVMAVPEESHLDHPEIQKAHLVLNSLEEASFGPDDLRNGIKIPN